MLITKPHENIIRIFLDSVKEKDKALKYLLNKGCVKTKYVEPFLLSAPEYLGQLKEEGQQWKNIHQILLLPFQSII